MDRFAWWQAWALNPLPESSILSRFSNAGVGQW